MRSRSLALSLQISLLSSLGLLVVACGGVSSGTSDDMGGNAGTGGNGPGPHTPTCTMPKVSDYDPNIVECAEGYSYRKSAGTCSVDPEYAKQQRALPGGGSTDCSMDASVCDAFPFGSCMYSAPISPFCVQGCAADEDCGSGFTCRCVGTSVGQCVSSDQCNSDADCADGYHCTPDGFSCGGPTTYSCQTPKDECFSDNDCRGSDSGGGVGPQSALFCFSWSVGEPRVCATLPSCGRPFLVRAEARVAPVQADSRWGNRPSCAPRLDGLSLTERSEQAEHWTRMGQMEHASIAAFARFNLQLLSLGAPADLVEACNSALVDETNHAQLCFGLASAFAGRAIGPGPLNVAMSLEQTSLLDVVDLVLAEGCFGETSAALEALELLEISQDPAIAAAYRQIAADEQRHAELAFRFVAWAIERDASVAERIEAALRDYPTTPEVRDVVATCFGALLNRRAAA
jgi:hypothetical protein